MITPANGRYSHLQDLPLTRPLGGPSAVPLTSQVATSWLEQIAREVLDPAATFAVPGPPLAEVLAPYVAGRRPGDPRIRLAQVLQASLAGAPPGPLDLSGLPPEVVLSLPATITQFFGRLPRLRLPAHLTRAPPWLSGPGHCPSHLEVDHFDGERFDLRQPALRRLSLVIGPALRSVHVHRDTELQATGPQGLRHVRTEPPRSTHDPEPARCKVLRGSGTQRVDVHLYGRAGQPLGVHPFPGRLWADSPRRLPEGHYVNSNGRGVDSSGVSVECAPMCHKFQQQYRLWRADPLGPALVERVDACMGSVAAIRRSFTPADRAGYATSMETARFFICRSADATAIFSIAAQRMSPGQHIVFSCGIEAEPRGHASSFVLECDEQAGRRLYTLRHHDPNASNLVLGYASPDPGAFARLSFHGDLHQPLGGANGLVVFGQLPDDDGAAPPADGQPAPREVTLVGALDQSQRPALLRTMLLRTATLPADLLARWFDEADTTGRQALLSAWTASVHPRDATLACTFAQVVAAQCSAGHIDNAQLVAALNGRDELVRKTIVRRTPDQRAVLGDFDLFSLGEFLGTLLQARCVTPQQAARVLLGPHWPDRSHAREALQYGQLRQVKGTVDIIDRWRNQGLITADEHTQMWAACDRFGPAHPLHAAVT